MKTIKLAVGLAALLLAIASCSSPLSNRMNDYVDEVESKCENWNADEWVESQELYNQMIEEYEKNYDSYSPEEKDAINRAIGRYSGLMLKQGFNEVGETLKDFGEKIPSMIDGFMSAFEDEE